MSEQRRSTDVVIVGAGVAGVILAALLADRGLQVAVLEQRYQRPRDGSFAGVVTDADFDSLDLGRPPGGALRPLGRVTIFDLQDTVEPSHPLIAGAFVLRHEDLLAWLQSRALEGGVRFELDATVGSLRWSGGAVSGVNVRGGTQWDARVVVLADESDPRLAEEPGLRPDWTPDQLMHVAKQRFIAGTDSVSASGPPSAAAICTGRATWARAGFGTLIPWEGSSTLTAAMLLEDEMASGRHISEFLDEMRRHPTIAAAINERAPVAEATEVIPVGGVARPHRLTGDGVLLMGDVAGLTHPLNRDGLSANADVAKLAAQAIIDAGQTGDFSSIALSRFEERVRDQVVDLLRSKARAESVPSEMAWTVSTRFPPLADVARASRVDSPGPLGGRGSDQGPVSLRSRLVGIGQRLRHGARP